jgi:diazepam-binding inhibitor (GABA receptor modulating acyl-CoA-binding protein)
LKNFFLSVKENFFNKFFSLNMSFEEAAEFIANAKDLHLRQDQQLELYANFKQATEGDCARSKPAFYQWAELHKWQAWSNLKGRSTQEAKNVYIQLVHQYAPGWTQLGTNTGDENTSSLFMTDAEYEVYRDEKRRKHASEAVTAPLSGVLSRFQQQQQPSDDDADHVWFEWCRQGDVGRLQQHVVTLEQAQCRDASVRLFYS